MIKNFSEYGNLVFPLNLNIPELIKQEAIDYYLNSNEIIWKSDIVKQTYYVGIFSSEKKFTGKNVKTDLHHNNDFQWKFTPHSLKEWIEENLLLYFDIKPRIAIIKTVDRNNLHVDCSEYNFYHQIPEFKFRLILQGDKADLFYYSEDKGLFNMNIPSECYVMNTTAAHCSINHRPEPRLILGIGLPWSGEINNKMYDLAELSKNQYFEFINQDINQIKNIKFNDFNYEKYST